MLTRTFGHTILLIVPKNLHRIVKVLREGRGWTQQELADRARLSRQFISYVENEKQMPGMEALEKISSAFGLSLSEFWSIDCSNVLTKGVING